MTISIIIIYVILLIQTLLLSNLQKQIEKIIERFDKE